MMSWEGKCLSLIDLIEPFDLKTGSKGGRPPYPLPTMGGSTEIDRISERVHCRCLPVIRAWPVVAFERLETLWMATSIPLQSHRESSLPLKQVLMISTPKGSIGIDCSALLRATPGSKTVAAIRTATNAYHALA
jgi:hypothetical protein